jgi:hypothetical protein
MSEDQRSRTLSKKWLTRAGNAITINAGSGDSVHLRGLTLEGNPTGTLRGILFNTGGNLAIENCVVRNFGNVGIEILPTTSSSFSVSNTIASNNNAGGIAIVPNGSAVVTGVLSKVTANNNTFGGGITVRGSSTTGASLNVTIVDSEASNNPGNGILAISSSGSAATVVMLRNVVASNNLLGLGAGVNAILRVAHSVVTGNSTGVSIGTSGGTIFSYGDNDIDGNTSNNTGLLTVIPTH